MGNHRFSLSDMIPNSWFYKLKEMGKNTTRNQKKISKKKHHQNHSQSSSSSSETTSQRKSYYFTRDLNFPPPPHHIASPAAEPPRKSSKKRRSTTRKSCSRTSTPRIVNSSVSGGCSCRASMESVWTKPEEFPDSPLDSTSDSSGSPEIISGDHPHHQEHNHLEIASKIDLPPIITKPKINKFDKSINNVEIKHESNRASNLGNRKSDNNVTKTRENRACSVRKIQGNSSSSQGIKLRTNSPRIGNRRITQGRGSNAGVPESFVVVKSSKDPQRDFRESMVEMIVENKIKGSKELENLLACYLSLNSNEYHDLIINVFKQIWFDFDVNNVRLN